MFKTYLTIAIRILKRNKVFFLLNVLGLSIGIAATLLIFLVIHYERSYDDYQPKRNRIYRVVTTHLSRNTGEIMARKGGAPLGLADVIRQDLPDLEAVGATWEQGPSQIIIPAKNLQDEKKFKERGIFFSEPGLFQMFQFKWLAGNASDLSAPNTAVITESLANKYFGNWQSAMGKIVQLWSFRVPFRIIGVFRDLPGNTDLPIRFATSYTTFKDRNKPDFNYNYRYHYLSTNSQLFVLLPENKDPGADKARTETRLAALVHKYYGEEEDKTLPLSRLSLQPLPEMHMDDRYDTYQVNRLSSKTLWILGIIGAFVLTVACINFINLSTAQSVKRAKEIGVRKVLGSNRGQLFRQFLYETALITFIAVLLGCLLTTLFLPSLRNIVHKPITPDLLYSPVLLLFVLLTGIAVILLAGFYPAVILSGFDPIAAIKSRISIRTVGGVSLRKGLVVFQFVIAQLLIIGAIVVARQVRFFHQYPLGFHKSGIALIEIPSDSADQTRYGYLQQQLSAIPGVSATSYCMDAPSNNYALESSFYLDNSMKKNDFTVSTQFCDTGYLNTFGIRLVAGRLPYKGDSAAGELLVNEKLVEGLGLHSSEEILGRPIALNNPYWKFRITGVVRNFHSKSLRDPIVPIVMIPQTAYYNFVAIRMDPTRMQNTLEQAKKIFTRIFPSYVYDCNIFDENLNEMYAAESITGELVKDFSVLAIFISCLGLYGLVSFMILQKTREVGIRKALGASVKNILFLFSEEFTLLPGVAFLISAPLGYYFMDRWLSGYSYHIALSWEVFLTAILLSVAIAWLTVGYNALKAALANPVKSLRTE